MSFAFEKPAAPEPILAYPLTITNGTALTGAVSLGGNAPIRLLMPAAWTAATITFSVSPDGIAYEDLYKADGTEYSLTVAANHAVLLNAADFEGVQFLKVRSGTGGAPVNQAADRALTLLARGVA